MYAQDVVEHQHQIEGIILQNWIAVQSLALEAPAFLHVFRVLPSESDISGVLFRDTPSDFPEQKRENG